MRKIRVPKGFRDRFDYYCYRANLNKEEIETVRRQVRENFEEWGQWVMDSAECYYFIDKVWGGVKPTAAQVKEYLDSKGFKVEDPTLFDRLGIMLQVRLCARVAGRIPVKY